jgi:hypothetical protein
MSTSLDYCASIVHRGAEDRFLRVLEPLIVREMLARLS